MKTDEKRIESEKRKWSSVQQTPYIPNQSDLLNKKFIENEHYDNSQMKFVYEQSINQSNGNQKHTGELIDMEMNENIAYVNILYDENMLTNIQEVLAPEPNYVNFETNWNNADILDLDQRNYFYETQATTTDGTEIGSNKMEQLQTQEIQQQVNMIGQPCHGDQSQSYDLYTENQSTQMQSAVTNNTGEKKK